MGRQNSPALWPINDCGAKQAHEKLIWQTQKLETYYEENTARRPLTCSNLIQMIVDDVRIQIDCRVWNSRAEMNVDEFDLNGEKKQSG